MLLLSVLVRFYSSFGFGIQAVWAYSLSASNLLSFSIILMISSSESASMSSETTATTSNCPYLFNHRQFVYSEIHVTEQSSYSVIVECSFYWGKYVVAYHVQGKDRYKNPYFQIVCVLICVHMIFRCLLIAWWKTINSHGCLPSTPCVIGYLHYHYTIFCYSLFLGNKIVTQR